MAGVNNLPYSVLVQFLQMIKATNMKVSVLFDPDTKWDQLKLNYRDVIGFF